MYLNNYVQHVRVNFLSANKNKIKENKLPWTGYTMDHQ